MTYLNPVLAFGVRRFAKEAADAGVDGLMIPDLPAEESGLVLEDARSQGLDLVGFVSPATPASRLDRVLHVASGFVYCIAVTGITGARSQLDPALFKLLDTVRQKTGLPLAAGFGISRPEHLSDLKGRADAAIVASALLDEIGGSPEPPEQVVRNFVRQLKSEPGPGRALASRAGK
jgi:tryptophan synthase alpha chain